MGSMQTPVIDFCLASVLRMAVRNFEGQTYTDAVFPNDLFSYYLELTTAVVVSSEGPKKFLRTSI